MTITSTRDRGHRNSNERGSSDDRKRRKHWLLETFGDGTEAPCHECGFRVTFHTIHVDRHPIPRREGGTYERGNIKPHCPTCSMREGARVRNGR